MKIKYRRFGDDEYVEIDIYQFYITYDRLSGTTLLEYYAQGFSDCVSVENVCEVHIEKI